MTNPRQILWWIPSKADEKNSKNQSFGIVLSASLGVTEHFISKADFLEPRELKWCVFYQQKWWKILV